MLRKVICHPWRPFARKCGYLTVCLSDCRLGCLSLLVELNCIEITERSSEPGPGTDVDADLGISACESAHLPIEKEDEN